MSRRAVISLIFSLCLFAIAGAQTDRRSAGSAETDDYSIDNYELTVESRAGTSSVRVTMDITYWIRSGQKSTGFKYIGNYEAEGLSGTDGDGKTIRTSTEHQRETRINWSFTPVGPGTKRVILTFTIPNAITNGSRDTNEFEAEWAGVFKVPVKQAVYRFVFPDNVHRNVVCSPADYTARERNNCRSIEVTQTPFENATFEMTFWPKIVDAQSSIASLSQPGIARLTGGMKSFLGVAVVIIVVIALVALANKAKRAGRGGSSSWWAGSSCAGGSSCSSSSSCGSSCGGGGCGGGCGG